MKYFNYPIQIIFIVVFLLSQGNLQIFAQKQIDDQLLGWVVYQGNHKLNSQFNAHTEYQWRRANSFSEWQQSLARVGLDYHFNKELTFSGGYAWVVSYPYGLQPIAAQTQENRLWEQVNLAQQLNKLQIQHRYRYEQRWIDTVFRQRIRYRAQVIIPLQATYPTEGNGLFLNVNNELFLGFGNGIEKNILDQNRFISAMGYQFSPDFNIQFGYLNQMIFKANGIQIERNHTLWTAVIYNLNFSK